MFAHVTIRASDPAMSERFYRTVLGAIGIEPTHDVPEIVAWDDYALCGWVVGGTRASSSAALGQPSR